MTSASTPLPGARLGAAALALALLAPLAGCAGDNPRQLVQLSGPSMGATWKVSIAPGPEGLASAARIDIDQAIRDTLTRIEALMTTWDAGSELSRFNRSDSLEPFAVAPETFEVFRWAVKLGEESGGALDVTLSPVVEAWGFGAASDTPVAPPEPAQLRRLLAATGLRHLEMDPDGRWVRKRRADVRCDFSSLAPGYAADRVAALLDERGLRDFLVDVGGELVGRGQNLAGAPWQVAIERPGEGPRRATRVVPIRNAAIATSGDYRNYREVDGVRVSHIIDPRTGRPVAHRLASVTVVDPLCVRADALATAMMVLGPDEGMALAERLDLAVLMMVRTPAGSFEERMSPRFERLLAD